MELEEMKNVWASVDERLKKQEILKECIVKEMIYKKTNKSLNILLWSELIAIPIILGIIPFIVWAYEKFGGKRVMWDIYTFYAGLFCVVYFPYLLYKAFLLIKIDLADKIKNNLLYINKFDIIIKKEKIVMSFFFGPLFIILLIPMLIEAKANVFIWILAICLIIFATLYTYWSYKKIYDKNIQSIKRNLEELNELKEE